MLIGAGISTIGSLIGSGKQQNAIRNAANIEATAATKASNTSTEAMNSANQFTKDAYGNTLSSVAPYQQAGAQALGQLSAGTAAGGQFNSTPTADQVMGQDPGYAFRLQQGQQALERAEAAGGSVGSGGALKAGAEYGQNFASNEYANAFNRFNQTRQENYSNLAGIAGYGQNANQLAAQTGMSAANNVSNTTLQGTKMATGYSTDAASAQAGGLIGVANSQAAALGQIGTAAQGAAAQYSQSQSGYGGSLGTFGSDGSQFTKADMANQFGAVDYMRNS